MRWDVHEVKFIPWGRERLPTPVFWPGEFHGLYSPWHCKESDITEWLSLSSLFKDFLLPLKYIFFHKLMVAIISSCVCVLMSYQNKNLATLCWSPKFISKFYWSMEFWSLERAVSVHCGNFARTSLEQSQTDSLVPGKSENHYPVVKLQQLFQGWECTEPHPAQLRVPSPPTLGTVVQGSPLLSNILTCLIATTLWEPELNWELKFVVVFQLLSHVRLFVTPQTAARQASLSSTVSWDLLKFVSVESVMISNHLIFCCFFLLLPSIFPSTRISFSNESVLCIGWPKLELQLQHQSFQWIFRVDLL